MSTENHSYKLGGSLAIAIGILYLLLGIMLLLSQTEGVQDYEKVLPAFSSSPAIDIVYGIAASLIGLLALGYVPQLSKFVGSDRSAILTWVMYMALLGFAVDAVDQLRSLNILPFLADSFVNGDAATRSAVLASQPLRWVDTTCFFRFGLPGLWILVVSIIAFDSKKLNTGLCVIGFAGAGFLWLAVIGNLLQSTIVIAIGAGAAIVIGPVWNIWIGMTLIKSR